MSSTSSSHRGRRFLLWSFGIIFATSLVIAIGVNRLLKPDRVVSRLHDDFAQSIAVPVRATVQLNLGPLVLAPARILIGLLEDVPPEAQLALSAARRASVGIYSIDDNRTAINPNALFECASRSMNGRDWVRVIAVRDGDESVMVYLPRKWSPDDQVNLCVAVCDGRELVLISARLRTGPLATLAAIHLPSDFLGPI